MLALHEHFKQKHQNVKKQSDESFPVCPLSGKKNYQMPAEDYDD